MPLRPYQEEMVNRIMDAFQEHRRVMCQMPTGTGKTEVFIEVIQKFLNASPHQKVLIIVHRKELLKQVVDRLRRSANIPAGTIEAGRTVQSGYRVHVGMIKSLRRDKDFNRSLIVIDEAHHSKAEEYLKQIDRLMEDGVAKLLGVTATPARLDGKRLSDVFETLLDSESVRWYIENGHLSKMRYYGVSDIDLSSLSYSPWLGDFEIRSSSSLMRSSKVLAETLTTYLTYAQGKKTLIFCVDTNHSKAVQEKFLEAGIYTNIIDYTTEPEKREKYLEYFRNHPGRVMINTQIFTEGFDCPDIDVVMIARPTQSITLYMQMIGRVTRKAEGKEFGMVLDNAGNYKIHGLPTSEFDWKGMFYNFDNLSNQDFSERVREKNKISTRKAPNESPDLEMVEIIDENSFNSCYALDQTNENPFTGSSLNMNPSVSMDQTQIYGQVWQRQNLYVDRFRNGDPIPEARTEMEWKQAAAMKQPAWCHYENDPDNGRIHGKLYNGYAVMDSRGLAPEGWRIPLDKDWEELSNTLGGKVLSGGRLKCDQGWMPFGPTTGNGINDVNFDGLPGGMRSEEGLFDLKGRFGYWWSASPEGDEGAWNIYLTRNDGFMLREYSSLGEGMSVRCIQDQVIQEKPVDQSSSSSEKLEEAMVANPIVLPTSPVPPAPPPIPFVEYESVTIGDQVWMKKDLDVGRFRNGDRILCARTVAQWLKAAEEKRPAWCYYKNEWGGELFGRLYNRYAVLDPRGLAPLGWSIPTDYDWDRLISFLQEGQSELYDLLDASWKVPVNSGRECNKTGFSAIGGGYRNHMGEFSGKELTAYWWTSTVLPETQNSDRCKYITPNRSHGNVLIISQKFQMGCGFSIRCLKKETHT